MGYNLQESLNTMGTLLGVHPSLSLDGKQIAVHFHQFYPQNRPIVALEKMGSTKLKSVHNLGCPPSQ